MVLWVFVNNNLLIFMNTEYSEIYNWLLDEIDSMVKYEFVSRKYFEQFLVELANKIDLDLTDTLEGHDDLPF